MAFLYWMKYIYARRIFWQTRACAASYYHNAGWSGQLFLVRTDKNMNFDWQDGTPAPFPFSVEWQGILFANTYGNCVVR